MPLKILPSRLSKSNMVIEFPNINWFSQKFVLGISGYLLILDQIYEIQNGGPNKAKSVFQESINLHQVQYTAVFVV